MFLRSLRALFFSCRYEESHRELYVMLTKALVVANFLWLMGNMICSQALGIAAHSAEVLIFYVIFACVMGLVSTVVIKRAVSKLHIPISELLHQCRSAFIIQIFLSGLLMLLVSFPCVFAAFAKALRSIPFLGYLFRQVYEAIEPLFMITLFFVFLVAVLMPLTTPFILLLVKQPIIHWREVFFEKIRPRIISSLSPLLAAFFLWFVVESIKCTIEWFFPVGGLLSALIRSSLYSLAEVLVFWTSLYCFFDVARANTKR